MTTPHNSASKGDIAKCVLMPGDPLRAKFVADTYLEDVKQFNTVRNMFGYTGLYKGKRVSVMASGMGMPSIGIYCYELYNFYDVETIIRIGTCGSMQHDVNIKDTIIAMGACTDSNFAHQYDLNGTYSAIATYDLVEKAVKSAKDKGIKYHVGNILSSDLFYSANDKYASKKTNNWAHLGVLGVEMESYALFATAAYFSKKALGIFTVSDSIVDKVEPTSPTEREKTFTDMMEIALEIVDGD